MAHPNGSLNLVDQVPVELIHLYKREVEGREKREGEREKKTERKKKENSSIQQLHPDIRGTVSTRVTNLMS